MWKTLLVGFASFMGWLVLLAVGREVMFAFQARPAAEVIGNAVSAVGSLAWVDTTLVTGLAAVGAAAFSIRAIKEQIASSEKSASEAIGLTDTIERDRKNAKREAARAVLPLSLSAICDYAERSGSELYKLIRKCDDGRLPQNVELPKFPSVPAEAAAALKEMVEYSTAAERRAFAVLVGEVQVQSSRLRSLSTKEHGITGVLQANLESYLADSVEIYARASDLFDFGRYPDAKVPEHVSDSSISTGFHTMGVWDDQIIARVARQVIRDMKLRPPEG